MTNEIKISGTLSDQPALRKAKNNKFFATFSVAVARKDSKFIDYINCICWDNDLAQQIAAQGMRDSEVAVAGTLQTNQYKNKHNETCKSYEVVTTLFRIKRGTGTQQTNANQQNAQKNANYQNQQSTYQQAPQTNQQAAQPTYQAAPNSNPAPQSAPGSQKEALDQAIANIEQTPSDNLFDPTA